MSVLNAREKKSLLYNTEALFSAGEIELGEIMAVMDALVDDNDPMIGRAVVGTMGGFLYLVDSDNEAMFGQFVAKKLTPWFTKLKDFYVANTDANIRGTVSRAMIFTDEQKITKTLDFALSDHVSPANAITNIYAAMSSLDDQTMFYAWLDQNFDALSKKMPAYHMARMPEYFSTSCDAGNIKLAEKFYADKKSHFKGMARSYDIAIYSAKQCLSLKEENQANFNRYLKVATKS
jgi:hypothetical protein